MQRNDLLVMLNKAFDNKQALTVEVQIPNLDETLFITHPFESIQDKILYYMNEFSTTLIQNEPPHMRIVGAHLEDLVIHAQKYIRCTKCEHDNPADDSVPRLYGEFGCPYIICQNCQEHIYLDDEDGLKLTSENIIYPNHFVTYQNGVQVTDSEVQEWVRKAAKYLEDNPDRDYWYIASGNTMVIGFGHDDDISIYVMKNYEETAFDRKGE